MRIHVEPAQFVPRRRQRIDETFLLDEIEDEDDDESPLLSQIVPTDETVKEEQQLIIPEK